MAKVTNVLLVDDNYDNRYRVMLMLQQFANVQVKIAKDYDEAIHNISATWFDVVLVYKITEENVKIATKFKEMMGQRIIEKSPIVVFATEEKQAVEGGGFFAKLFAKKPKHPPHSPMIFDKTYPKMLNIDILQDKFFANILGSIRKENVKYDSGEDIAMMKMRMDRDIAHAMEILELKSNARLEDIKRNYRLLAKEYHPDYAKGDPVKTQQKFLEIKQAYEDIMHYLEENKYHDF